MKRIYFYILIRSRKAFPYFDRCVDSVFSQKYKNFKIIFVDDASPYSVKKKNHIRNRLKGHIVVFNKKRKYSLRNAYDSIHKYCKDEHSVIFNLDGDDWLPHRDCLTEVVNSYEKHREISLTYGECLIWDGKKVSIKGSSKIFKTNLPYERNLKDFRKKVFLPLHPRTWRVSIFKSIPKSEFLDSSGNWLRFAEDMAIFFPMLEKLKSSQIKVIKRPIYVYNTANPNADVTQNLMPLLKDELEIRKKHTKNITSFLNKAVSIYSIKALNFPITGTMIKALRTSLVGVSLKNKILFNDVTKKPIKNLLSKINFMNLSGIRGIVNDQSDFKILDSDFIDLKEMTSKNLYKLMWMLLSCDAVTAKSKNSLAKILPSNYPVVKI